MSNKVEVERLVIPENTHRWYVNFNKTFGPISSAELRNLMRKKTLSLDTPIRREDQSQWLSLSDSEVGQWAEVSELSRGEGNSGRIPSRKKSRTRKLLEVTLLLSILLLAAYVTQNVRSVYEDLTRELERNGRLTEVIESQKTEIENIKRQLRESGKERASEPASPPSPPEKKARIPELPVVRTFTHQIKQLRGYRQLDILWVIDNSGSMGDDQENVIGNTGRFIDQFAKFTELDWKMGLISTDEENTPYVGFSPASALDRMVSEPVKLFQSAVRRLGTEGSGEEKVFTPVMHTLTVHTDFLRKKAILALIIVTDAMEQSKGVDAPKFLKFLTRLKGDSKKILVYGVLGARDLGCHDKGEEGSWDYAGSVYEKIITKTKSKAYPLCNEHFGDQLANIGKDLVKRVKTLRVPLKTKPVSSSVKVTYLGQDLPEGSKKSGGLWVYEPLENSVLFHDLNFAPKENAEVAVTYEEQASYE